ncbi:MAG: acyl-CoA dehydrogenase family protein [Acidimicrobiia bacterium]|nr:acyl-CoA dehydrogenase family protein [Acidimicrobiia bacterium]
MITVDEFARTASAWLDSNRAGAPRDYGAILPADLADAGRAWQAQLFAAGFAGIHWPTEYGGRGLTPEHTGAWVTACAIAEVPPVLNMVGNVLTAGALLAYGTPEQCAEELPKILSGERVWCQLFSEPEAGSDLASLATRAERDGDRWVVNGQKVWCSNGRIADRGILLARTDAAVPSHRGISFFLVDMHAPGIDTQALRQMNGGAEFDEVFLTDLEVPADALLGPEGMGWTVAMSALTNERGYIGAAGIAFQRRLDAMLAMGGDLDPIGRQALTDLWIRGSNLKVMGERQGPVASVLASIAKLGTTELMFDTAVTRTTAAGAAGMLAGPAADGLLSAPGARIAGGTSQIQRNIIGERILGLPKEPKAAKP